MSDKSFGVVCFPGSTMSSFDRGRLLPVAYDLGDGVIFVPMESNADDARERLEKIESSVKLRRRTKHGIGSPH